MCEFLYALEEQQTKDCQKLVFDTFKFVNVCACQLIYLELYHLNNSTTLTIMLVQYLLHNDLYYLNYEPTHNLQLFYQCNYNGHSSVSLECIAYGTPWFEFLSSS